ncbi:hypothetical protein [Botrimarina sp.]|uniref:hypothetical protein n=1 Tax=Botrimarina sp. TaxID=2795802 RepID=UPI0032EBB9E4
MPTQTKARLRLCAAGATARGAEDFAAYEAGPTLLSFEEAAARERRCVATADSDTASLLGEALDLARRFGCEVRRRRLGGIGGGCRWVGARRRIVLDLDSTAATRLAVVADALRGEPRLPYTPMSQELTEYLRPTRAA